VIKNGFGKIVPENISHPLAVASGFGNTWWETVIVPWVSS